MDPVRTEQRPDGAGYDHPQGVALDTVNHQLFVSDGSNVRVLVYTLTSSNTFPAGSGGHTASYVIGQTSLQGANISASGQSQFQYPIGIAIDTVNSRLFVADNQNNRVMFSAHPLPATAERDRCSGRVCLCLYGWSSHTIDLNGPGDVAYDSVNQNLYVADVANNRVMIFNVPPGFANGKNASYEFGQPSGGSEFTTHATADTQSGMNGPAPLPTIR